MTATILALLEPDGATVGRGRIGNEGSAYGRWLVKGSIIGGLVVAAYGGHGHAWR